MIKYSLEFLNFSEVLDCREWVLTGPNMFVPSFCQYPSCTIRYCTGVHCSDITQGTYIIEQYTFIMYKGFQKNQGTWKRTVFGMTKKSFQVSRFLYYPKICNVFHKILIVSLLKRVDAIVFIIVNIFHHFIQFRNVLIILTIIH